MPIAKDSAQSEEKKSVKSQTTPQVVNMYRKIMVLEELLELREARYKAELKKWKEDIKARPEVLEGKSPKDYLELKHRDFYSHEMKTIDDWTNKRQKLKDFMARYRKFSFLYEDEELSPGSVPPKELQSAELHLLEKLTEDERVEYHDLKWKYEVGLPQTVKGSYFTDDFSKNSPDYAEAKAKVKNMIKASVPAGVKGAKGEALGVVNLFNQKYKGVKKHLNALEKKYPAEARSAKAMLSTGMIFLNPSPYLIGKGVSAIVSTKQFQKLDKVISKQVNRVAEKTGLKYHIKKMMSSPKGKTYSKVALGVVAAIGTGMTVSGMLDIEQAKEMYLNTSDFLSSLEAAAGTALDYQMEGESPLDSALASVENQFDEVKENVSQKMGDISDYFEAHLYENTEVVADEMKRTGAEVLNDLDSGLDIPAAEAPVNDVHANDVPANDAPANDAPANDAPANDAPANDAPANDVPANDAPANDAPANDAPANDAPANDAPANDAPANEAPANEAPDVEDEVSLSTTLPESKYTVQSGDVPSVIAELRMKEAGITGYDYSTIEKVVYMTAEANGGLDNIHYIQAGKDLVLPELNAEILANYTIPEIDAKPELDVSLNEDLTLPPSLDITGIEISSENALSEEIQERLEQGGVAYSIEDIDALTSEVLFYNGIKVEELENGQFVDMKVIDDILEHFAVAPTAEPKVDLEATNSVVQEVALNNDVKVSLEKNSSSPAMRR